MFCFLVLDESVHLLQVGGLIHVATSFALCLIRACSSAKSRKLLAISICQCPSLLALYVVKQMVRYRLGLQCGCNSITSNLCYSGHKLVGILKIVKKKGSQEFTVTPLCIKLQYSYFFTFPKNITLLTILFLHTDRENEKKKTTYIFGLPHHMALLVRMY